MKFHLQGMGLVGALTARLLDTLGYDFTWNDTDTQFSAWPASTGCVFPTGELMDIECMDKWRTMVRGLHLRKYMETAVWCYTSKNPPHNGAKAGVRAARHLGPITVSNMPTFQFNVQRLVLDTREMFEAKRTDRVKARRQLIITHGSATAVRYTWGWSGQMKLRLDKELARMEVRPCIYMRKVYDVAYLYPVPGSSLYYGGTSTITQKLPKSRSVSDQYRPWKAKVAERSGGLVTVVGVRKGSLQEGWRPVAAEGTPFVTWKGEVMFLKPMGGNGVRHWPALSAAIVEEISNG